MTAVIRRWDVGVVGCLVVVLDMGLVGTFGCQCCCVDGVQDVDGDLFEAVG